MKKLIILCTALVAFTSAAVAQTFTEGKIVYKISYPDLGGMAGMESMLPKETTTYIKGNKVRTEQEQPMMGKVITISDNKTGNSSTYMNMMGSKYEITSNRADYEKNNATTLNAKVEITNETKVICGYTCKKAIATYTEDGETITQEIWFAPDLKGVDTGMRPYKGIDGMFLEFSQGQKTQMGSITMKITATLVSKDAVSDAMFKKPEGEWKKTSAADLAKSMGGK